MLARNLYNQDKLQHKPTRDGFGDGLVDAAKADKRVVALCADLTESTRVEKFAKAFPDRFVEMGVAEQNMVTVASGMAAAGKIPFAASYAVFSPGRNLEQIRTTICINNQPVKIVGSHSGLGVGPDGATHQALEDLALMRTLPNMTVICPADANEARKATAAAAKTKSPVYIRLSRNATPIFTTASAPFTIGRAEVLKEGVDATIIATGPMVYEALQAAKKLADHKVRVEVINSHTIKPLDEATILRSLKKTGGGVVVEEHQKAGGLGGAIAELTATMLPTPLEFVGVDDAYGESGSPDELLEAYELTSPVIVDAVLRVHKRGSQS